jgi:hypothetical protein
MTTNGDPGVGSVIVYCVGHNMVGYLPESDVWYTERWDDAKSSLLDDLDRYADHLAEMIEEGTESEELNEVDTAMNELKSADGPEWGWITGNLSWWIATEEMTPEQWAEVERWQDQ